MKRRLVQMMNEDAGVLSFEWVLVITIIVIGIVGGLTAARDAIIDELGDASQAVIALDQSYTIDTPLVIAIDGVANTSSDSEFIDSATFTDCARTTLTDNQPGQVDSPN